MWVGPPPRLMKIADLARALGSTSPACGQPQVAGEGQAGRAERADLQEVAPPDAVAVAMGRHSSVLFMSEGVCSGCLMSVGLAPRARDRSAAVG